MTVRFHVPRIDSTPKVALWSLNEDQQSGGYNFLAGCSLHIALTVYIIS
jgi:hypothetical protein